MGINPRHVGITVHRKSLLIVFLVADNLAPAAIRITNFVRSAIDCLDFRLARAQGMDVRDTIADPAVVAGVILGGNPMRIEILEIRKISGMLPINDDEQDTGQSLALMDNYLNTITLIQLPGSPINSVHLMWRLHREMTFSRGLLLILSC